MNRRAFVGASAMGALGVVAGRSRQDDLYQNTATRGSGAVIASEFRSVVVDGTAASTPISIPASKLTPYAHKKPRPTTKDDAEFRANIGDLIEWYLFNGRSYTDSMFYTALGSYSPVRLAEARERLRNITRTKALALIFDTLTANCRTNTEKHIAILNFLQEATFPNYWSAPPLECDALWLLELGDIVCGHVSKIAVGLFNAAGYPATIFTVNGHVIANIKYDPDVNTPPGKDLPDCLPGDTSKEYFHYWHYFDASVFSGSNRLSRVEVNGVIPSAQYLLIHGTLINQLALSWRPSSNGPKIWKQHTMPQMSGLFEEYGGYTRKPFSIYACDTEDGPQGPAQYPSGYYNVRQEYFATSYHPPTVYARGIPMPPTGSQDTLTPNCPSAPTLHSAKAHRREGSSTATVQVSWDMPGPTRLFCDPYGDLYGYKLYVSSETRGWNYDSDLDQLPPSLRALKSGASPWSPAKYVRRFALPTADIFSAVFGTDLSITRVHIPKGMVDARTLRIGRSLQPATTEPTAWADVITCEFGCHPNRELFVSVMVIGRMGAAVGREMFPVSEEIRLVT